MAKVLKDEPIETLGEFIARHEEAAQGLGIVVTAVAFPDVPAGLHQGKYAGIVVRDGKKEATYSDGTHHN